MNHSEKSNKVLAWQILGTYIFEYGKGAYLLIIDYFSKYPEMYALQGNLVSDEIKHFKTVFA